VAALAATAAGLWEVLVNTLLRLPDAPARRIRAQSRVTVTGIIWSAETIAVGSSPAYHLTLADADGELTVLFLGRPSVRGLQPGTCVTVEGRVGTYHGELTLWNPRYVVHQFSTRGEQLLTS
jgi:RecG-like helicase